METRQSHLQGILVMVAGSAATYGVMSLCLSGLQKRALSAPQRLDLACFEFLAWWWIAYFLLSHLNRADTPGRWSLFTLRSFLDGISSHRGDSEKLTAVRLNEQLLREKARSSRDVQGIMIAVVVLLLTLVVVDQHAVTQLTEYQRMLQGPVFAIALMIILAWMLSMDIFDTTLNSFQVTLPEAFHLRRYFYRFIGPIKPKSSIGFSGAVSYGYLGHALMPVFALMVFSWFQADLVGFATAFYVVFAYPYYFGYWAVKVDKQPLEEAMRQQDGEWTDADFAGITAHWMINPDGDRAVRLASGRVFRQSSSSEAPRGHPGGSWPDAARWPVLTLGLGFLLASIAVTVI